MIPTEPKRSFTDTEGDAGHRTGWLLGIAGIVALLHLCTNHLYGFHSDELQFLSDAKHLDWGFVAYPPFTPWVEHLSLQAFGLSMTGLRLASMLAQSLAIVLTGLMTRQIGGGRLAQTAAALAVALSPISLFEGTEFQYTSFDYLWWVLAAYFVVRLLTAEDPRWWLAIGATIGVGILTKYTILIFVAGLFCGFLATSARRLLMNRWFLGGLLTALLLVLPNFLWQVNHGFIAYRFLQSIHLRDVRLGRTNGFILKQFFVCTNFYATPLWLTGLYLSSRRPRYRPLAWMYLLPLAFLSFAHGLFYYLAPAYPMLIAMGSAGGERWASALPVRWQRAVVVVLLLGLTGTGLYSAALTIPLSSNGPLMRFALDHNDALREEIGWDDLVKSVASIRDSLPLAQQSSVGVLVGNYGEEGAIELLGQPYHLPQPISMTNSAWLRGYPNPRRSRSSSSAFRAKRQRTPSSPAGSPGKTATASASRTRKASVTRISLSAQAQGSPGPSSGRSTRTSAESPESIGKRVLHDPTRPCGVYRGVPPAP